METERTKRLSTLFSSSRVRYQRPFKVLEIINEIKPDAIVHTAAQPSHDKAHPFI